MSSRLTAVQQGTEVMNKINLENIDLTYQATSRFSLTLSVPLLFASRRSNNSYYTTTSSGIGDTSLVAQVWLWNPKHAKRGNISIGFGLQAPTGKDNVSNNVLTSATATTQTVVVDDYSIQPGSGGWGMVFQWQAFRDLGKDTSSTPMAITWPRRAATTTCCAAPARSANPSPLTTPFRTSTCSRPVWRIPSRKIKGLTVTFGPRMEGVPAAT